MQDPAGTFTEHEPAGPSHAPAGAELRADDAGRAGAEGFRLSPQQERLWLAQEAAGSARFSAQCLLIAEGDLRADALAAALGAVVARHEILRTSFQRLPGMSLPVQVIADKCDPPEIISHDFSSPDERTRQTELAAVFAEAARGFDLTSEPLRRVHVARLAPGRAALALSLPALYADRAGIENLARELARAYAESAGGAVLAGEPLQYADLAEWQHELLESEETEEGRRFWRERGAAAPAPLRLDAEKQPRPGSPFAPRKLVMPLVAETAARLRELAARERAPVETVLHACWQALLSRLTGRAEVPTGVAYDGRAHEGVRDALGLFARVLPFAASIGADATLAELVRQTDAAEREAAKWQDYFAWPPAVSEAPGAGVEREEFYGFCFEWSPGAAPTQAAGVRFLPASVEVCAERFKLKLLCREDAGAANSAAGGGAALGGELTECEARGGALSVELHFDESFYAEGEARALLARYLRLLESGAARPEAPLAELDILPAEERRRVLSEFNDTRADFGPALTLDELFEAQVARTPDAPALVYEQERLTYAELNARANRLARHLIKLGVGAETIVGLFIERSVEMVVALLGVLKAGAAYVPLDPEYPQERVRFMLEDACAPLLLTQARLADRLPGHDARVLRLDENWHEIARESPDNIARANAESGARRATPANLAYLIYTSGSTGRPKGVMVSHAAISNRLLWMQSEHPLTTEDRVLQKTAFSFDASVWELFLPLLVGAQVVMARPGGHQDAAYLSEVVKAQQVTTLQLVPTMLAVMLDEPSFADCRSLRRVWCGGEAVSTELQRRFFATFASAELHNLYGPTETAIDASHWLCERGSPRPFVPIGRPLANLQAYVLDAGMSPVAVGSAGELYVGGAQLARGYHHRPGLTAEKFVPDPFGGEEGARLYRTGDLARWGADGVLEYLGRADHQVKLRGFRIELGEIEAALAEHEGVRECAAVVREDEAGHKRLVAYVVPRQAWGPVAAVAAGALYRLPNGLEVAHLNRNETEVIYQEIFADLAYLRHGVALREGACVFDVGANIGLFTLFVHHACRGARVFAFEPVPATFERLKQNVERYGLAAELYQCGVSDRAGLARFTFYPKMSAMSGLYPDTTEDTEVARAFMRNQDESLSPYADELLDGRFERETFDCRLKTVSEVIREHNVGRVDLLKVDVEKSELDVLRGIEEADWVKIDQIVIEVHDTGSRLSEIEGLLSARGFRVVAEQDALLKDTGIYNLYATRPSARDAEAEPEGPRLVRALAPVGGRELTAEELRAFAGERLPEYMTPAAFVLLKSLPLAPNGKLDRRALPAPEPSGAPADAYAAPRDAAESALARIWEQILGLPRVGIHDNFFSLGGDSILSIQIVARANQQGLRLSPAMLFKHQTIAELATAAGTAPAVRAEQGAVTGDVPLTPAQHWFFSLDVPVRDHWNQSVMLATRRPLDAPLLRAAVAHLFAHHDALRLRFVREGGGWRQFNAGDEAAVPFSIFDLAGLAEPEQKAAVEREAAALQAGLDITAGPLARVAYFDFGAGLPGRLLFVAHHLAVDGVSWRVLLEDLQQAHEQLARGERVTLAPKTTPFRDWSRRLSEYAQSEAAREELSYWMADARRAVSPLPVDACGEANTSEAARTVSVRLTEEETDALLHRVPQIYNTQIGEALLAAVAQSFAGWTGERSLLVDVEGHGREEEVVGGVDLSRTVGWFTSLYPVLLEVGAGARPPDALKSVKERLREVPHRGIGYGLLRHLAREGDAPARLSAMPRAEVSFNYLGQFDQTLDEAGLFALAPESGGPNVCAGAERTHLLEIAGIVGGGCLRVTWTYAGGVHRRETVEALAESFVAHLRALIEHCLAPGARALSPSDFPLAGVDEAQLERLAAGAGEIEDIYPLSPLQEGMLFHTVYAPRSGVYVEQVGCTITGPLDADAFVRAWQAVADRHAVLRTAFVWEGLDRPLQVIRRGVGVPCEVQDWRASASVEREQHLSEFLREDRLRGFEPAVAPLMRLALLRTDDDSHYCVWSFHHLLLDGWCVRLLLGEVYAFVETLMRGEELRAETARPFRDYIAWLQGRPEEAAEDYWRRALRGFTAPTPLGGVAAAEDPQHEHRTEQVRLSSESMEALQAFTRRNKLTMNTMVQAAWALVLSRHAGTNDVVFGTVVSGRPAELPGVETIVGPFINTLPVRVRVEPDAGLLAWLKGLQSQQAEARVYEHSPLVRVKGWSEVPAALPLFESLLTFENRPADLAPPRANEGEPSGVRIGNVFHFTRNSFPLTVVANPAGRLTFVASYDVARFEAATIARLLARLQRTLENMIANPEARVGEIDSTTESERAEEAEARRRQETAKVSRFKSVKPKAVQLSPAALVSRSYLTEGGTFPLVLRPGVGDLDPFGWAASNRELIAAELLKHGAILFRDFALRTVGDFERFAESIHPNLFSDYGDLPREEAGRKVYKSTPYPADRAILFHNESSHLRRWPLKQWFFCVTAAETGGETPIVDCRRVYRALDPSLVAKFAEKRLMYVRNFTDGLDVSWQEFFKTDDRTEVERLCQQAEVECAWKADGLSTRQVCRAVAAHPHTGEPVFFNQLQLHHVSRLGDETRAAMCALFAEEDYPRNVYYGDGTPIEDEVVEEIVRVYRENSAAFPWRAGDVLMLDNMLAAHGRNPFTGARKIVVAMGEMISAGDLPGGES